MFYDNYVRLCNALGKTPSAVALEIGIQKSTVTRWSQGRVPNRATALKVADYFGVSVDALLDGTITQDDLKKGQKKEPTDTMANGLSATQRELIDLVSSLSESDAAVLLAALKAKL